MMEQRQLDGIGLVSTLTLGGGGLGQLWGPTSRDEAVATVRRAVEAGINLLDLAPLYGNGEAERVIGEAFAGDLPAGVRVETKCFLGTPPADELYPRLSLDRGGPGESEKGEDIDLNGFGISIWNEEAK